MIQRKQNLGTAWSVCGEETWVGCTRYRCEEHCISGCKDCAKYRKRQEEREEKKLDDEMKELYRLWEEGRTAREEEKAKFWQEELEKEEKEEQELDREMKRPTREHP